MLCCFKSFTNGITSIFKSMEWRVDKEIDPLKSHGLIETNIVIMLGTWLSGGGMMSIHLNVAFLFDL